MRWIGSFLILGLTAASAQAQVTCGAVLSAGSYVMTSDLLSCASDPALTLSGDAELDMNAHRLTCDSSASIGILLNGGGNTIFNGAVSDCGIGVRVAGEGSHSLSKLAIIDNDGDGIAVASDKNTLTTIYSADNGGKQIYLSGDGNKATRCDTHGGSAGIQVNGDKNKISDSSAATSAIGFVVEAGTGNSFKACAAVRNDGDGFQSAGTATKITSCFSVENGDDAFSLGGSDHVVTKSTAIGNAYGLTVGFDNGACNGCSVTGNRVVDTSGWSLYANGSATTVAKNGVSGGDTAGLDVGNDTTQGKGVSVGGNVVLHVSTVGISVRDAGAKISKNIVVDSGTADLSDSDAACTDNDWSDNVYATRVQGCEQ